MPHYQNTLSAIFLLESDSLSEDEKREFRQISVDMEDNEASYALKALTGICPGITAKGTYFPG